jgi:hypothetical protein
VAKRKAKAGEIDDHPQIPELEDKQDEALIRAARNYANKRQAKVAAMGQEKAAHDAVKKLMHERGISKYRYKGLEITLDLTEKAAVTINTEEESDE